MSMATVDGTLGLKEQNQTLEFKQNTEGAKLVKYQKDNVSIENIATFQDLPLGDDVPTLTLVEVPPGKSPSDVKPDDTTLTFDDIVYVNGTATRVALFHST